MKGKIIEVIRLVDLNLLNPANRGIPILLISMINSDYNKLIQAGIQPHSAILIAIHTQKTKIAGILNATSKEERSNILRIVVTQVLSNGVFNGGAASLFNELTRLMTKDEALTVFSISMLGAMAEILKTGVCYNYSAYALIHLIQNGVSDCSLISFHSPDTPQISHTVLVTGEIQKANTLLDLKNGNGFIIDPWALDVLERKELSDDKFQSQKSAQISKIERLNVRIVSQILKSYPQVLERYKVVMQSLTPKIDEVLDNLVSVLSSVTLAEQLSEAELIKYKKLIDASSGHFLVDDPSDTARADNLKHSICVLESRDEKFSHNSEQARLNCSSIQLSGFTDAFFHNPQQQSSFEELASIDSTDLHAKTNPG